MHLAQINIAKPKFRLDAPEIADFVGNLAPVNGIAESSPGFIWRLQDESGDATSVNAFDDPELLVNMSVWESVEALKAFMFKTHHIHFLKRKKEWFHTLEHAAYALWWVPVGHIPGVEEAAQRLAHLTEHGETAYAFSFKSKFSAGDHAPSKVRATDSTHNLEAS